MKCYVISQEFSNVKETRGQSEVRSLDGGNWRVLNLGDDDGSVFVGETELLRIPHAYCVIRRAS